MDGERLALGFDSYLLIEREKTMNDNIINREKSVTSVMIVGVGGQGSLLASKLLGRLLLDEGYDVKVSEVHGMSQRGGSVVTYVRFGNKVYSPIIDEGEADYIISFEKLEAARWAYCLKKGGVIITNAGETDPMPVITGAVLYPHEALSELRAKGVKIDEIDALSLAAKAGSTKAVNIVLMGRAARHFGIPLEKWRAAIAATVAPKFVAMNELAFDLGYSD